MSIGWNENEATLAWLLTLKAKHGVMCSWILSTVIGIVLLSLTSHADLVPVPGHATLPGTGSDHNSYEELLIFNLS